MHSQRIYSAHAAAQKQPLSLSQLDAPWCFLFTFTFTFFAALDEGPRSRVSTAQRSRDHRCASDDRTAVDARALIRLCKVVVLLRQILTAMRRLVLPPAW